MAVPVLTLVVVVLSQDTFVLESQVPVDVDRAIVGVNLTPDAMEVQRVESIRNQQS